MKGVLDGGRRQRVLFFGTFGGYAVQGLKDLSEIRDVGWLVWSWPMADPVHLFWVSGTTFYRGSNGVLEVLPNVDPAERSAIQEAIWAWERDLHSGASSETPSNIPLSQASGPS
jgi:hypothetical protein